MLAAEPFRISEVTRLHVVDANGDLVLVCFDDEDGPEMINHCDRKYSQRKIEANPNFSCPCGRIGIRMSE